MVNPPLAAGAEAKAFAITVENEAGSATPTMLNCDDGHGRIGAENAVPEYLASPGGGCPYMSDLNFFRLLIPDLYCFGNERVFFSVGAGNITERGLGR